MFLSCGDALFDLFAGPSGDPAMIQLEGRAGGAPMNVAIGLSRLGQKAGFFSKISRDSFGERILAHLANEAVDTRLIVRTDLLSTLAIVSLDAAGTARYSFYIENTADRSITEAELPAALPDDIKVIHIGGSYSTAIEPSASSFVAFVAREKGRRLISYDPNIRDSVAPDLDLWRARVAKLAAMADLIKASEEDLAKLYPGRGADEVAGDWIAGGASLVIITHGGKGAMGFAAKGAAARVLGVKVEVIDTVGAGDTFQAATLDWLDRKGRLSPEALAALSSQELNAMLSYAAKAAAITCSRRGADLPRAAELEGAFFVTSSLALQEIHAAPEAVRSMLAVNAAKFERLAERLVKLRPSAMVTIARGSSDHAAMFFKYLCEIKLGVPVASLGPSLATLYQAPLRMKGLASLAISQSGASPDLVVLQEAVRRAGALTIAAVNAPGSPLAEASEVALDLAAGPEQSVAATKSFVASAALGAALVAYWAKDAKLTAALERLPDLIAAALECDWSAGVEALARAQSLYVIGRGPGLAMAGEAALKLKEMCGLHAEAYSAAELLHGPVALAGANFPALVFESGGSDASPVELAGRLAGEGVPVFLAGGEAKGAVRLPVARTDHPLTDHIAVIASFYVFAEALARRRGFDPDRPPKLKKVTRTV